MGTIIAFIAGYAVLVAAVIYAGWRYQRFMAKRRDVFPENDGDDQ